MPGIVAKPRIVLILVERYDPEALYREPLVSLGYAYDHRDELHVLFKGSREGTPFNLHVEEEGSEDAAKMIVFRGCVGVRPSGIVTRRNRTRPGEAPRGV